MGNALNFNLCYDGRVDVLNAKYAADDGPGMYNTEEIYPRWCTRDCVLTENELGVMRKSWEGINSWSSDAFQTEMKVLRERERRGEEGGG